MAINLTGFLGGLGTGFDSYAKEKRARTMEDRLQQREDLAQQKLDEGTSRGIYDRLVQLSKDDAADEAETLKRLRLPTIDATAKQQELEARRQRHENAKLIAGQLAAQPGVTKLFGNVSGILRPSMASGPGFQMPSPEVDPTRAFDLLTKERARIEGITTPGVRKEGIVAQSRKSLEGLVPKEMLDRILPEFGASLGFGTPSQPAKAIEDPTKFFAENQGFKMGEGGERVLPTGARQRVFYQDGKAMVEYAPELKATYESPDLLAARTKVASEQARKLEGLYSPTIRKAEADATLSEWKGKLAGKQYEWFDKVQGAKVFKDRLVKSGSGSSDALRRMSILLAHQDRVASMNQRGEQFQQMMGFRGAGLSLQSKELMQRAESDYLKNSLQLDKDIRAARSAAGASTDKAMGASQQAALQNLAALEQQKKTMDAQFGALRAGDTNLASQIIGLSGNMASIDPMAMAQPQQQGGVDTNALIQMMMAQGMAGGGQQQQQMPQQPIQIFAGGQPGMAGGMDQTAMMNAMLNALMQRGIIPQGTNQQGKFIPAGEAGSVFPKIPQLIARRAEIRKGMGLMFTPDSVIDELAYKYPKGLPPGPEGELIKQAYAMRERVYKKRQPAEAAETARRLKEEREQSPEAQQERMKGQSTSRGGGGYPGARGAQ